MNYAQQEQLVQNLEDLTKAGKARWLRPKADLNYAYCFLKNEKLVFCGIYDDEDEEFPPDITSQEPIGISADIRNVKLLWLPGLEGWDKILSLLQNAVLDDELYIELDRSCTQALFLWIESETNSIGM